LGGTHLSALIRIDYWSPSSSLIRFFLRMSESPFAVPRSANSTTFLSGTVYVIGASLSILTLNWLAERGGSMHHPSSLRKTLTAWANSFVQALSLDFYRVVDTFCVAVTDPAECHEASL
jgi:hypothetical protein